jgi:hypothetical protein
VKKTRQTKNPKSGSDSIRTEMTLEANLVGNKGLHPTIGHFTRSASGKSPFRAQSGTDEMPAMPLRHFF